MFCEGMGVNLGQEGELAKVRFDKGGHIDKRAWHQKFGEKCELHLLKY
jgi:hypothetical protein